MVFQYEKILFFCKKRKGHLKGEAPMQSQRRSEILPSFTEDEILEDDFDSIGEPYPKTEE